MSGPFRDGIKSSYLKVVPCEWHCPLVALMVKWEMGCCILVVIDVK